jgi:hypothetical protein
MGWSKKGLDTTPLKLCADAVDQGAEPALRVVTVSALKRCPLAFESVITFIA